MHMSFGYFYQLDYLYLIGMLMWGSKNKHHKDACLKEIRLQSQILIH